MEIYEKKKATRKKMLKKKFQRDVSCLLHTGYTVCMCMDILLSSLQLKDKNKKRKFTRQGLLKGKREI